MKYETLEEILNGDLNEEEEKKESKSALFVKSLEDKEVMKKEAKKASKLALELSNGFSNEPANI
ncbi:hypothetical protein AVANS14531_00205 [Campylobacter sp. Cr9]|uniref:hypothetical protein n=1 Tax=unclassified Campylobacter TaxID=2593542 RepID=UPI001EFB4E35|nr:hypothetical protein [Campylobacter sp. RM5004]MBZ7984758.1 hypothetical protein [Campylobacter sp. Cr9]ULO02030.1 hypothetical protein AVANS_1416 [Campylobacter sp. RM5004]